MTGAVTDVVAGVVRTVLGDVSPADLGVVYAHEHLVIDGGTAKIINPGISLQSVSDAVRELAPCREAGVATVVDAMPADAGRNVSKLAEISRASGLHVVVATGLHHARYYGERHWAELLPASTLADLFVADIEQGVDELDYNGPVVRRTPHRAGIVKIAGSERGLSRRDRVVVEAAAETARRTGVAVLTHCEGGLGGVEQVMALITHGVLPARIALSHTDKVPDPSYHRDLLNTGARLVYDQGLRTPSQTARLVAAAVEMGHGSSVLLGTDGARRSLWTTLGGGPGLAALRTDLGSRILTALGPEACEQIWVTNPAHLLTLRPTT